MVNYQSINLPPQVPKGIAINIYRIAQEALRNIARHAKATTVDLALLGQGDTILLTIKDNGQGFDPEGEKMAGLGLASMRERALLIGADFAIHTQPKGGTVIEVTAPLTRSNG
jgi:signal transduction histidine kinase